MANRKIRSSILVLITAMAVLAFPVASSANIMASASLTFTGTNVVVDAPGHQASLSVTNTNSPPQQADFNTVTTLSLAPSCGAVRNADNLCPLPDIGAITLGTTATGDPTTACAGRTFDITGPDGTGVYTFTVQGAAIVLAPPGGGAATGTCNIIFPIFFRRVPVIDTNVAAGIQTRANSRARLTHNLSGVMVTSYPSLEITIAAPAGGNGVSDFNGDGSTDRGIYRNGAWFVHNQTTVFHGLTGFLPVPADYDGNGTTDRMVFDNGAWYNHTKPTVFFGLPGDIPVPADYNDDGSVDRAVYRNGAWHVEGQPTVFFGLAGDIPVPGDYNGDGDAERAVYRDGGWFVEGMDTVFFGLAGDIPVPADYNGDGDLERAVYRGSVWYREGLAEVFWGVPGDIPVPADYNNDNFADIAVFRAGAWHVVGFSTVFFGLSGDIPLPLPQAVYRKFF